MVFEIETLDDLKRQINRATQKHKSPDIFWRNSKEEINEIRILRRWNSHSPSITNIYGGGYYIRWANKGTIIDPGYSFIKLFRRRTQYTMNDIDLVVVTHDHIDHCQDLAALITLFRQYNNWCVKKKKNGFPRTWDMLISYGVADQYNSLFNNPDNHPFLFRQRISINQTVELKSIGNIPEFLNDAQKLELLNKDSYQQIFHEQIADTFEKKYSYKLDALPANHKELFGNTTSFGLKISLTDNEKKRNNNPVIVITGDTSINADSNKNDGKLLSNCYKDAELLILHVGSIEDVGAVRYTKDHLGFQGIVEILKRIYKTSPRKLKLVVLTEWGYEFGLLGLNGRSLFTSFVAQELNNAGCNKYYAAIQMPGSSQLQDFPRNGIPIIPADISLRIQLPNLQIFTQNDPNQGLWSDFHKVYARESLERIDYFEI
jgi:hypothetical protein